MNMYKKLSFTTVLSLLLISAIALAAPGIPNRFHGYVNFINGAAPDGLTVDAKIDGTIVASITTSGGKYGYAPNVFDITDPDSNRAGKTISFFVNGIDTGKTATFANGASTELNLQISGYVNELPATNEPISNQIVAVNQTSPAKVTVGDSLAITLSSDNSGIATIQNITKLSGTFFSGAYAVPSGKNELNAFEIKITGNVTITVTMKYDDVGIDESTILPYRFDGTNWVALPIVSRDTTSNTITFIISSAQTPYAIMGSPVQNTPPATSSSGGGNGGTAVPANNATACTPNWSCSDWSSCINGIQTRSCTDINNCGSTANRPPLSQNCTAPVQSKEQTMPSTTGTQEKVTQPYTPTGFLTSATAKGGAVIAAILIITVISWYARKKRILKTKPPR